MERKGLLTGVAAMTVWLAGHSAMAEPPFKPSSEPEIAGQQAEQRSDRMERPADSSQGWKYLHGRVERIKRVALRGGPEGDHLVALLNGGRGHRMIVDLGPAREYRGSPIMTGDHIGVRGPLAWISDRKVLLAQRLAAGGHIIKIQRDPAVDQRHIDRRTLQGDEKSVTGQIEQAKELRLHGLDKQHVVVRLKTQDGKQMLADLGAPQDLAGVSLERGRSITVKGPTIQVSDKPMILARQVSAEGKNVQVDRDVRSVMPAALPGGDRQPQAADRETIGGEVEKTEAGSSGEPPAVSHVQ